MAGEAPRVYLLHGEDELAIKQFISTLQSKMGDQGIATLNTTRLNGSSLSLEELRMVTGAMPVLAPRRLVIVESPSSGLVSELSRAKFIEILDHLPSSTALVLVEYRNLAEEKQDKGKLHWLLAWSQAAGQRAYVRSFALPKGIDMHRWIQQKAESFGGKLTRQAAELLADHVGEDPRLAIQEINKLLSYVKYSRPVTPADVHELTPYAGYPEDFALVNALRERNRHQALHILHQELGRNEPLTILQGIVGLFRRLLMARDVIERGGEETEMASQLKISPGYAHYLTEQARKFSMADLSQIYHKLLEIDEDIKTGRMEGDIALDSWIASFTTQP